MQIVTNLFIYSKLKLKSFRNSLKVGIIKENNIKNREKYFHDKLFISIAIFRQFFLKSFKFFIVNSIFVSH